MNRSKKMVIGALIGGSALASAVFFGHASAKAGGGAEGSLSGERRQGAGAGANAARSALRCDFQPGDRLGFSILSRSSYIMSVAQIVDASGAAAGASEKPRETRSIDGDLLIRVLDAAPASGGSPAMFTLAAVIDRPKVSVSGAPSADIQAELAAPVVFQMDSECRMHGFGLSAPVSATTANLWKGTLKMAEVVIPSPGNLASWSAEQTDTTGVLLASYTRSDSAGGAASIKRSRGAYSALHNDAQGAVSASVLRSSSTASFSPGAGLFRDLRVEERVALKMNGATMADVETSMALAQKDVSGVASELWTKELRAGSIAMRPMSELTPLPPPLPYANRPAIEGLRDRPLASILAEVGSLLAKTPQADFDSALNLLVQSLRIEPGRARAMLDELRRGYPDDDTRSVIFLGLGLAGGKEAREVLMDAMRDRRLSEKDRLQAISALAGVPDPDRAVTAALLEARGEDGSATLALGSLAHNPRVSAEEKARVMEALEGDLARAGTAGEKVSAIAALGNAGDPRARERVAGFTQSADPGVAAEAYRSLKKMNALPPAGELLDAYSRATDRREQAAIAEALSGAKLGAGEVTRAVSLLEKEQPSASRAALIRLLGSVAGESAAAKAALVRQFKLESEPSLLSLLGRYLKPSDLR
jgi:hypothetical protein